MAAAPARRASGRPVTGPWVAVRRVEIVRHSEIGRRAEIAHRAENARDSGIAQQAENARDSGIARAIRLAATGFARRGPGQAANNVRAGTAARISGVARAGPGRCAGVEDGTSRWLLNRAQPLISRPCRHSLNPHRRRPRSRPPTSRPRARRNSFSRPAGASGQKSGRVRTCPKFWLVARGPVTSARGLPGAFIYVCRGLAGSAVSVQGLRQARQGEAAWARRCRRL